MGDGARWNSVPPVLRVGLWVAAAAALAYLLSFLSLSSGLSLDDGPSPALIVAEATRPMDAVGELLLAVGYVALAGRAGHARRWLQLAAAGSLGLAVLGLAFDLVATLQLGDLGVLRHAGRALALVVAVGLAGAAWRPRRALAFAVLGVWLAVQVERWILPASNLPFYLGQVLELVGLGLAAAIAAAVAGGAPALDRARTQHDLRGAARALCGGCVGMLAVLAVNAACASAGALAAFYGVGAAATLVVGALGAGWIGVALIRVARGPSGSIASASFAAAGALALWSALTLLALIYPVYAGGLFQRSRHGIDFTAPATWGLPLAIAIGAAAVTLAILRFARRHGATELVGRATRHLILIVAIAVALAVISALSLTYEVPLQVVLCAIPLGVVARLCAAAARVVGAQPELPGARVIGA